MGLDLKSPIIVGSCGLTNSLEKIQKMADYGAGAVVLKSIFEEQITNEIKQNIGNVDFNTDYAEALDYISGYTQMASFETYTQLINKCKQSVDIPIIASINCTSDGDWISYAKRLEEAGVDALELNIFFLPADFNLSGAANEERYYKIINHIREATRLPIAVKTSYYFSGLANFLQKLSYLDIQSLVLFNRFYAPDIDIDKLSIAASSALVENDGFYNSLRWIAILYKHVNCSLSATSGISGAEEAIKQILAGADTVQVVTALYNNGLDYLKTIHKKLEKWMDKHQFANIDDFKGKLGFVNQNSDAFLRIQFMKHFAGIE